MPYPTRPPAPTAAADPHPSTPTLRPELIEACQPEVRCACSATLMSEQRAGVGGSQLHAGCGLRSDRLVSVVGSVERPHLELRVVERAVTGLDGLRALAGSTTDSSAVHAAYDRHSEAAACAPGGRRWRAESSAAVVTVESEGPLDPDEAERMMDPGEAAAAMAADQEAGEEEVAYFEAEEAAAAHFEAAPEDAESAAPLLAASSAVAPTLQPWGSGAWWVAQRAGGERGLAIQ